MYISTIEANTNDPNTTPTGWLNLSKITAIAALAGGANKLPYFSGTSTAAQTDLTAFARQILAQTDAAGVRTSIGLTALGIGGQISPIANFDWQNKSFDTAGNYDVDARTWISPPPILSTYTSGYFAVEVIASVGTQTSSTAWTLLRVTQFNSNPSVRRSFIIDSFGALGARTYTTQEVFQSGSVIPVVNGGTGATTDAGARTNLSVPKGVDKQMCNEWCVFNGTTTVTMGDSIGISSVVRTGVGQYTVNLTTPYATTNYAITGRWTSTATLVDRDHELSVVPGKTTSSFQLYCASDSSNLYPPTDAIELSLAIWGVK